MVALQQQQQVLLLLLLLLLLLPHRSCLSLRSPRPTPCGFACPSLLQQQWQQQQQQQQRWGCWAAASSRYAAEAGGCTPELPPPAAASAAADKVGTAAAADPAAAAAAAADEEAAEAAEAAAAVSLALRAAEAAGGKANHLLFDAETFRRMQLLREEIHKLELANMQTVAETDVRGMAELLCEQRLLEDVLRLARNALLKRIQVPVPAAAAAAAAPPAAAASAAAAAAEKDSKKQQEVEAASASAAASLKRLELLAPQLLRHAANLRTKVATQKVERLLGLMLLGKPQQLDDLVDRLVVYRGLDEHFFVFLNRKIREAKTAKPRKPLAAQALRILRQRCMARLRLEAEGKAKFVGILAQAFQSPNANLPALVSSSLHSTEEIEDFCDWLQSGIAYGEEGKGLSRKQLDVMELLLTSAKAEHPLVSQHLDRWDEGISYRPNKTFEQMWDSLPDPPQQQQQQQHQQQQQQQEE